MSLLHRLGLAHPLFWVGRGGHRLRFVRVLCWTPSRLWCICLACPVLFFTIQMVPFNILGRQLPSCCGPSLWHSRGGELHTIWALRRYSWTTLSLVSLLRVPITCSMPRYLYVPSDISSISSPWSSTPPLCCNHPALRHTSSHPRLYPLLLRVPPPPPRSPLGPLGIFRRPSSRP